MTNIKPWKMMMLRGNQEEDDGRRRPDMTYMPPEGRRRNDHYPRMPDVGMRRRMDDGKAYPGTDMRRRMGFGGEPDETGMRRGSGAYMHGGGYEEYESEPIRFGGMIAMDEPWKRRQMTREMAMAWVDGMENADPSKPHGGKWSPEQVKAHAAKMGLPTEGEEFWSFYAIMNAMYSDYYEAAKKFNLHNSPEFFAEMAKAFLHDPDAVENKAAAYYECIVAK